jgi:hypothetical protein
MLAKEMNRLTFEERERIQEEIHGATSLAREESHLMVQRNLNAMQDEIENIPVKKAYQQTLELH